MKARGKEKGLDYWRRLAAQQINFRKGYTLISELVSAGEFPVAVSLYQHRVDEYDEKGAPLQWIAPNPLVGGDPNKISLLKNAPRPNAGKLFIDYMLSVEGQRLLQDKGRSPGRIVRWRVRVGHARAAARSESRSCAVRSARRGVTEI